MKVAEIMETDVKTVSEHSTIAEAVMVLADEHVLGVPVINSKGYMTGVLSTSDILEAAAECETAGERDRLFEKTSVREIMTPRPKTIDPDAEVKQAAQQMLYLEIHRLFVEYDGQLVGVISQSDVVRAVATAKI